MPDSVKVLLLRLLEDMNHKGIVSVPRSRLAAELGTAPARVSERIKLARELGYLDQVRRGRPGVTAVYQALIPPQLGTDSVPLTSPQLGTETRTCLGTESVPNSGGLEVRPDHTQVGNGSAYRPGIRPAPPQRGSNEKNPTPDPIERTA